MALTSRQVRNAVKRLKNEALVQDSTKMALMRDAVYQELKFRTARQKADQEYRERILVYPGDAPEYQPLSRRERKAAKTKRRSNFQGVAC